MNDTTNIRDASKDALDTFQRWLDSGHPWVPGALFRSNPGLDQHILEALKAWADKNE